MFIDHRKKVLEKMEDKSIAICYAGQEIYANEDDYLPFVVNSQFFWLTGLRRAGMVLVLTKKGDQTSQILFIDPYDPTTERWTGKMPTKEEVLEIAGECEVRYTDALESSLDRLLNHQDFRHVYFDVFKYSRKDIPTYNQVMAAEFCKAYPAMQLHDLHAIAAELRPVKDPEELAAMRKAIDLTRQGLEAVMTNLHPNKPEYQVQADFETACRYAGADYTMAFPTIAGGGIRSCMMHYMENSGMVGDGEMILLDLGAQYKNYKSDITRTYPASGKFTPRQREIYELVLKANRAIVAAAKPGVTLKELNQVAYDVMGQGLVAMGMLEKAEDVRKYAIHGCGHSLGVDVHDIQMDPDAKLEPGWVITDEPGLYIDDEVIGIRIEDDLLITEDGCEVLSADILRDPDEIEKFMAEHGTHVG